MFRPDKVPLFLLIMRVTSDQMSFACMGVAWGDEGYADCRGDKRADRK